MVCVRVVGERGRLIEEVRSFGATTPDLLELWDWLASLGVTHLAMERMGGMCGMKVHEFSGRHRLEVRLMSKV